MSPAPARCLAVTAFVLLAAGPLRAEPAPPATPHPAVAARDTTHFLPAWLRPWGEFGGGWMSSPRNLKSHYEGGQALAVGLEARPHPSWAIRSAIDYQILLANSNSNALFYDATTGGIDTAQVQSQTTGWIASSRTELGVRLPWDFWLTAGGGGGYMHSGLSGIETDVISDLQVATSGAVSNGWGWLWTAALRYDFMPVPRVPLGLDVRTSSLKRGHDTVQTWSIRACIRMPADEPGGTRHRGGYRR